MKHPLRNLLVSPPFLYVGLSVLAILTRAVMIPYRSLDLINVFQGWWERIQAMGTDKVFGKQFADYTLPHLYLMGLGVDLGFEAVTFLKLCSFVFEFLMAFAVLKIVKLHQPNARWLPFLFAGVLFLPTVLLNGAVWAQCDAHFTAFMLLMLYCFMVGKDGWALFWFAVAFAFKLQSIFLAPVLALWFIYRPQKWYYFLIVPVFFALVCLPAVWQGTPFHYAMGVYYLQIGPSKALGFNLPNVWIFFQNNVYDQITHLYAGRLFTSAQLMANAGVLFTVGVVAVCCLRYLQTRATFERSQLIPLSLLFALLIPFLLPHMHERYYYLAEMLALIYAFQVPKRFWMPIVLQVVSTLAYLPYLFYGEINRQNITEGLPVGYPVLVLAVCVTIVVVAKDLFFANSSITNRLQTPMSALE